MQLLPVTSIDWSDSRIGRAGVVPYAERNGEIWYGFGISSTLGSISVIGGGFEPTDFDLLSTVQREYREEIGDNLQEITPEMFRSSLVLKMDKFIAVLVKMDRVHVDFTPTEELSGVVWFSKKHLDTIKRTRVLDYPKTKLNMIKCSKTVEDMIEHLPSVLPTPVRAEGEIVRKRKVANDVSYRCFIYRTSDGRTVVGDRHGVSYRSDMGEVERSDCYRIYLDRRDSDRRECSMCLKLTLTKERYGLLLSEMRNAPTLREAVDAMDRAERDWYKSRMERPVRLRIFFLKNINRVNVLGIRNDLSVKNQLSLMERLDLF